MLLFSVGCVCVCSVCYLVKVKVGGLARAERWKWVMKMGGHLTEFKEGWLHKEVVHRFFDCQLISLSLFACPCYIIPASIFVAIIFKKVAAPNGVV